MSAFSYKSGILQALKSREKSITSFLIVITTGFLNHLFANAYFKCPSSSHEIYGWSFIIIPGLLLALLSLLGSTRLSNALTGACRVDIDAPREAPCGKHIRTWKFIIRNTVFALAFATLAFASWVVVTLLFTDVYTCTKIGPLPMNEDAQKEYLKHKEQMDTHAKLTGLFLMVTGVLLTFLFQLILKCLFSQLPKTDLAGLRSYDKIEATTANEEFLKLIKKSAEQTGRKIVKFMATKYQPKDQQLQKEVEADGGEQISAKEDIEEGIIERKHVTKIRSFLARRYPRLDNPSNVILPYCQPDIIPEDYYTADYSAFAFPSEYDHEY